MLAERASLFECTELDEAGEEVDRGKGKVQDFDEERQRLVIDVPTRGGQPMQTAEGATLELLVEINGVYYKFASKVLARALIEDSRGTHSVLELEAPPELKSGNRRRTFRVEPLATYPVTARWRPVIADVDQQAKFPWLKTVVHDISNRGLGLWIEPRLAQKLSQGIRLQAELRFPEVAKPVVVEAVVRRVVPIENARPDRQLVGLEFVLRQGDDDPDASHPQIANFIAESERRIARNRRTK